MESVRAVQRNRPRSLPHEPAGVGEVMQRTSCGLVADRCFRSRRTPMGEASFMSSPVHGWSGSETRGEGHQDSAGRGRGSRVRWGAVSRR